MNKMSTAPAIVINKLSLNYQHHNLFDALNFSLPAGKCSCLLGPSGVGKTSILRFIAGLSNDQVTTNSGTVTSCSVAYMAQQDLLMPWLSAIENILIGERLRGKKITTATNKRALELLDQVGLKNAANLLPEKLSGGMRQRVALARTLFEDRQVVLMDEPFSSLDAITRIKLQNLATELLKNRTVLLVTHDPFEALRIADYIYVMTGSPAKINLANLPNADLLTQYTKLLNML